MIRRISRSVVAINLRKELYDAIVRGDADPAAVVNEQVAEHLEQSDDYDYEAGDD